MLEILTTFSATQILIYTIMLALAIKGAVDFGKWGIQIYNEKFNKDYNKKKAEEELKNHYIKCQNQHLETAQWYEDLNQKLDGFTENINEKIDSLKEDIDRLTVSDMHDIKSWIVDKHHKYIKLGWIDDFTMDTIEQRFSDYTLEGGNSYIAGLVKELRELPHVPKESDKEE